MVNPEEQTAPPPARKGKQKGIKAAQRINKPVRLSIPQAAEEFGMDPKTLQKKLTQASELPGPDFKFSIAQIASVKYSARELEQTRKWREDADQRAMENARMREQLVDIDYVVRYCAAFGLAIKQLVLSSLALDNETKEQILMEIQPLFDAKSVTKSVCSK